MRSLVAAAALLLLALAVCARIPRAGLARAAELSTEDARREPAPTPARTALEFRPASGRERAESACARAPGAEPEGLEVGPGPDRARPVSDLLVLVLEHGTRMPLPEVGVQAWVHHERGVTIVPLAVAPDGSARIEADALRDATHLCFVLDDPQLGPEQSVLLERPLDEVLARGEPLELLVPRGPWREFLVVDRLGRPIEGATLEEYRLQPARTGPDGRGRVRLTAPPPTSVDVSAPGHRLEHASVPPADEPWVVALGDASRLELVLVGDGDARGYHALVRLPESMQQRTFHQSRYVQTPGRPLEGTPAHWSAERYRGASTWSLGFNGAGIAVLDQLYDEGVLEVELLHFDELLDFGLVPLAPDGRTTRVELHAPAPQQELAGRVVDQARRPIAGALVRMAPLGGRATVDLPGVPGFPAWAPSAETDAEGAFRLPSPRDDRAVLVVSRRGLADRAITVAELAAAGQVVELERGHTVVLEVLGRDGEPLDGGYSTGMAYLHVRPSVHLGHDVWRDASPDDHPAAAGDTQIPFFLFADLPPGVVEFRFTYLSDDERLRHDTRVPAARFVSRSVLGELRIGE